MTSRCARDGIAEMISMRALECLVTIVEQGSLTQAAAVLHLEGTVDHMMEMIHAHPTVWEAMGDGFASVRGLQINV